MLIAREAPPRPPCFDTHPDWVSWLQMAYESDERVLRRRDSGNTDPNRRTWHEVLPAKQIDYCKDCTARRQQRMETLGRCDPCDVGQTPKALAHS